jgi:flagellar hook-basal body complex protein FliE
VALAGAGALIAKNVQSLARIETINAQTAQTIKSMGNASKISATEVEGLAGSLESLTAIEAESIQEGANLLLTFGNIRNELGAGNDIFTQTTKIMVDMGVALKKGPVETATMLGKALNDPIRGMTALRKVGVSFTEQQLEQVKALQNTGDLMGAQRLILEELQKQYGGSGAAFAKTFTGQLELMGHELGTIGEEATMAVMPALQGMVAELRELIPIIGPQLKAAIESVDWKALTSSVVGLTTFFIQNAETIAKLVAGVFILNTAFKLMTVASGLVTVAIKIQEWATAKLAAGTAVATGTTKLLTAAMRLIPFVAVIGGLIMMTDQYNRTKTAIQNTIPTLSAFATETIAVGNSAAFLTPYLSVVKQILVALLGASAAADLLATKTPSVSKLTPRQADEILRRSGSELARTPAFVLPNIQSMLDAATGGGGSFADVIAQELASVNDAQAEAQRKEQEIINKRKNAYKSFTDSVKQLFGQIKDSILSSFNLPTLGNSVNSITRNISKLLERTRNFAKNISQLSGMGLNSALLQQVIQAGPMAGSQLASALVGGGSGFVEQINRAYTDFGNLAGGIAGVGTTGAFANQQTVNNYSIEVTGGLATGSDVGRAVVNAIRDYERQSGAAWRA